MRLKNSLKNITYGIISQVVLTFCLFFTRTFFIKYLGSEILGLNSLFTNIMSIFSLAELGVGQAINFHLYKLIATNDRMKIASIMVLYKKVYIKIGTIIFTLGVLTIPFIKFLTGNSLNVNVYLVYFLFILNSAVSYMYIYKSTLIIATQKSYIINKINILILFITNIIQILIIIKTKNYIFFVIVQIISIFIQNIIISKIADKMYPYINYENIKPISKTEKKNIFKDVKILMLYKIGTISLNSTDNIIISKLINLSVVGILSNYNLIIKSVNGIIGSIFNSIVASVGNLNASENIEKQEQIFNVINFIAFWIYGICSIELAILINPFIKIWIGETFLFEKATVLILILNFYLSGMLTVTFMFRQTTGLFRYGKYRPIISAIINLVLSIILGIKLGVSGILLATLITRISTNYWFDPYIIYKKNFKTKYSNYLSKQLLYMVILIGQYVLCQKINNVIGVENFIKIIICFMCIFIITNFINIIIFYRGNEFKYLRKSLIKVLKKGGSSN